MKAYLMKITIKDTKPPIWRRIIIPMGITFEQLHQIIITGFCWTGYHLYEFELPKNSLRVVADEEGLEDFYYMPREYTTIGVNEVINEYLVVGDKFKYTYDFGDDWEHRIEIEDLIDWDKRYPQVIKYKGDCIPEDCGGIYGYYELLENLRTEQPGENFETVEDLRQWAEQQGFSEYDMSQVNDTMAQNLVFPMKRTKSKVVKSREASEPAISSKKKMDQEIEKMLNSYEKLKYGNDSLEDLFEYYRKEDIIEIAKKHSINGYSYYNKKELIPFVAGEILKPDCMERLFRCLHDSEIEVFERAEKLQGAIVEEEEEDYAIFLEYGYAGQTILGDIIIPKMVFDTYHLFANKEFHRKRKRNVLIVDYCNGLVELYGIVPMEQVMETFRLYEKRELNDDEIFQLYYGGLSTHCNYYIKDRMLVHNELETEDGYRQLLREQGSKPFYIPSRGELMELGEYGLRQLSEAMKKLFQYLVDDMNTDEELAVEACYIIDNRISWGCRLQDVFDIINERGIVIEDDKQLSKLVPLINELWNNTRIIANRGFTPLELIEQERNQGRNKNNIISFEQAKASSKKIYPNDPCPCGSGKKYKHCCGKV